jgi:hypothetical protein
MTPDASTAANVQFELRYVSCAANPKVLKEALASSKAFVNPQARLCVSFGASSAAQAVNRTLRQLRTQTAFDAAPVAQPNLTFNADSERFANAETSSGVAWLIWLHEDVWLPDSWEARFRSQLAAAIAKWPNLALAGVFGIDGRAKESKPIGHVKDRGRVLGTSEGLPAIADSLDELLIAIRVDSDLWLDERLGFDFYGTDLVLQAKQNGMCAAVLDAYCEHWSNTPQTGPISPALICRVGQSAAVFEAKWAAALPITTTCFTIKTLGDVARSLTAMQPEQPAVPDLAQA